MIRVRGESLLSSSILVISLFMAAPVMAAPVMAAPVMAAPQEKAGDTPIMETAPADAATVETAPADVNSSDTAEGDENGASIVVTARKTRSAMQIDGAEIQKILPGASPLKAIEALPGVTFMTADPWGNNEQNISLYVHGFNAQQLGYTLDGIPLGDQNYGNFNGLSPQRAVISENVSRVLLANGAGDLGTASTSNLGGTIDTFSSDPNEDAAANIRQTFGSHSTSRTYARVDSGNLGGGNKFYLSGLRQRAHAWDFHAHQGGYQANAKFMHEDDKNKLTIYFDYSDKTEPNEDSIAITTATKGSVPYKRPFLYPDFQGAVNYLSSPQYVSDGPNYHNYYSDAQRTDYLTYLKYDRNFSDKISWSNQFYYHHNDGVGVVAGPMTAAGLPKLFSYYYPGQNLQAVFGGSGFATRTTEYKINRYGAISKIKAEIGNHKIELGGWYEHQSSMATRRWYALYLNRPSTPYQRPRDHDDPRITQYRSHVYVNEYQMHIQDSWEIRDNVTLQAGFKSEIQVARQHIPVQPIAGSSPGFIALPVGRIRTARWFLPQVGGLWDIDAHDHLFFNIQKNMRQFQTSAAAGLSPFALGSQTAFDQFRASVNPETSWTYEAGFRTQHRFHFGPITGFDGQISYYHVNFKDRLLSISPTPVVISIVGGAPILENVGRVKTDGVDIAGTFHFGSHFSLYDAFSYNRTRYQDNYTSGTTVVHTKGKYVPGSPKWLNKFIANFSYGAFDMQLMGDYVGKRYTTFTNDLSTSGYFLLGLSASANVPLPGKLPLQKATISLNVTNLTNKRAYSTVSVGAPSGTYNAFPVAPRQYFVTLNLGF